MCKIQRLILKAVFNAWLFVFKTINHIFSLYNMKVVSPEDTNHYFKIIPRYYEFTTLEVNLVFTDEATDVSKDYPNLATTTVDGITSFVINWPDLVEGARYSFYISDNNSGEIIYRGRMLVTAQETQNFDITKNYITY